MMVRAGAYPKLWSDFNVNEIDTPYYEFPDDQGWIHKNARRSGMEGWKEWRLCLQEAGLAFGYRLSTARRASGYVQ